MTSPAVPAAAEHEAPAAVPSPAPVLELADPPTARTQALHASMRAHESTARGSRRALRLVIGATLVCALGFVLVLLLRRS